MQDHEYHKTVLENGMEVHSIKMAGAVKTYYEVLVQSGSNAEKSKTGIAHYLEHMFGYGSQEYGEKDLMPHFAQRGGWYNFSTGWDRTRYWAYAKPEKVFDYSERIATVITAPAFTPQHVEIERQPILTEALKSHDEWEQAAYVMAFVGKYGNHRIATPIIGKLSDIESITYADLREFYEGVYVAPNMIVLAAGDVDHDELVRRTEIQYALLPRQTAAFKSDPLSIKAGSQAIATESKTAELFLHFSLSKDASSDFVRDYIIANALNKKLHDVLREDKKMVYSINASIDNNPFERQLLINSAVNPQHADAIVKEIFDVLNDFARDVNEEHVKSYIANTEENLLDDVSNPMRVGENLSFFLNVGIGHVPMSASLDRAPRLTRQELQEGFVGMVGRGKVTLTTVGAVTSPMPINELVDDLRKNLPIETPEKAPNIAEDLDI